MRSFKPKREEKVYRFNPKPDITAYELARIVMNMRGYLNAEHIVVFSDTPIPDDLLRHFDEVIS